MARTFGRRGGVLALIAVLGAGSAVADLPQPLLDDALESIRLCKEVGGTPNLQGIDVTGAGRTAEVYTPYVTEADLNGDGQTDYITDLAGLECVNAWSLFCGSAGCPVTVWLSGSGGLEAAWGSHAQEWRLEGQAVVVSLHGQMCTPPRTGYDGCEVSLRFDGASSPGAAGAAPSDQAASPRPRARPGGAPAPVPTPAAAAPAPAPATSDAPALPSVMGDAASGWTHGQTADGAGWYARVDDPDSGARIDWLCAKGRTSLLALTPHDGAGTITIDVDGRVQSFEVQAENGTAYVPVAVGSPVFLHIASGQAFSVLDAGGAPVARFPMLGAPSAIGQAEGRCQF